MLTDLFSDCEDISMCRYGDILFWDMSSENTLKISIENYNNGHSKGTLTYKNGDSSIEHPVKLSFRQEEQHVLSFDENNTHYDINFKTDCNSCSFAVEMVGKPGSINKQYLYDLMDDSRAMIKTTLMDQDKIIGIGNEFSDEILYQAGIYPKKKATTLSDYEKEAIYDCMLEVYEFASKNRISYAEYPTTYITPRRYKGVACPMCAGRIARLKISGYNCFYCRDHQHG